MPEEASTMQNHPATPVSVSEPPNRLASSLIWLGWTLGYALYCYATYIAIDRGIGATSWWIAPLLALWAVGAFGIGYVFKHPSWFKGPLVIGVAPLVAVVVFSLYAAVTTNEDVLGYAMLGLLVMLFSITVPMALMSLVAAVGVRFGLKHQAAAMHPAPAAMAVRRRPLGPSTIRNPRPSERSHAPVAPPAPGADPQGTDNCPIAPMPGDLGAAHCPQTGG
jgi:hypothetical protein